MPPARIRGPVEPAAEHRHMTGGGVQYSDRVRAQDALMHPGGHYQTRGGRVRARGSRGSVGRGAEVSAGRGQIGQLARGEVA